MAVWELLGIEPTNDVTTIKRAYAKKLKVYHPEEDPEGYQKLREAYDYAVQLAKRQAAVEPEQEEIEVEENDWDTSYPYDEAQEDDEDSDDLVNDEAEEDDVDDDEDADDGNYEINRALINHVYLDRTYGFNHSEEERETYTGLPRQVNLDWTDGHFDESMLVDRFLQRVDALYHHYESRISVEEWTELLNDDIIWNVQQKGILSYSLLTYFQEHRYLPKSVWGLLENCFHWQERLHEDDDDDSDSSVASFIQYMKRQLTEPELRYEFLKNARNIDYDAFLYHREIACEALQVDDLDLAKHAIRQAYHIYSDDPDLLRLQGVFFLRTDNPESALASFSQAIRIHPNDLDGYFYRARIWLESGHLSKAIEECHTILDRVPGNVEALNLLGKCYLERGEKDKAQEIFLQVAGANPLDIEALAHLMPNRLLEKRSFIDKIKLYWELFPKLKIVIYIIFSVIFYNLMSDSMIKHTGFSPVAYVSNFLFDRQETKEVFADSSEQLEAGANLYHLQFERANFLGLFEYRLPDDNGEETPVYASYLELAQKKKPELTGRSSGWIYGGYVGNDEKVVILIANAELASALNEDKKLELTVQVNPVTSEDLPRLVNEMLEQPGLAHLAKDPIIVDRYLDAREQFIQQPVKSKVPWLVYIYALILINFGRLVLREIGRVYRAVRY